MNKTKDLFKNIGFLTISQFGTKILSFFLVPLYTSILTTEEYGTYDLFNTTIGLLIPFLTLNIKESSLRFAVDKENDKTEIFTISIYYCFKASALAVILIFINHIFEFSAIINDYKIFILILFISNALNGVICNFARGLDRLGDIAVSGVICSAVIIFVNIITLLPLKMGLVGYFLANIIGMCVQSMFLFIRFEGWRYFNLAPENKVLKNDMLTYSIPMIANCTAWWINSVSDRYIVIWFCGIAANGIYSVANKIPSILDVFQNIFCQAWTLSVVKDFDPDDKNGFMSRIFSMYNFAMTVMCSFFIIVSRILAKILYANDFYMAWKYVPFLFIAVMFGALAGYIGGIFTAMKASKIFAYSTVTGAIVNIVLNIILVRWTGALGAAIATGISYWVIFGMRMKFLKRFVNLKIKEKRNNLIYTILFIQSFLLLIYSEECVVLYILQVICFIVVLFLFIPELRNLYDLFRSCIIKISMKE